MDSGNVLAVSKIQLIKMLRQFLGLGLVECKAIAEQFTEAVISETPGNVYEFTRDDFYGLSCLCGAIRKGLVTLNGDYKLIWASPTTLSEADIRRVCGG